MILDSQSSDFQRVTPSREASYECLLDQHDHYSLGCGLSLSRRSGQPWYVYFNGTEVNARKGEEPMKFSTFKEAYEFALTWGLSP